VRHSDIEASELKREISRLKIENEEWLKKLRLLKTQASDVIKE